MLVRDTLASKSRVSVQRRPVAASSKKRATCPHRGSNAGLAERRKGEVLVEGSSPCVWILHASSARCCMYVGKPSSVRAFLRPGVGAAGRLLMAPRNTPTRQLRRSQESCQLFQPCNSLPCCQPLTAFCALRSTNAFSYSSSHNHQPLDKPICFRRRRSSATCITHQKHQRGT